VERKPTRNGDNMMGYAVLEGVTGSVELVLFPRTLAQVGDVFFPARPVMVSGKLNMRENQKNSILVDELLPLQSVVPTLYLRFSELTSDRAKDAVGLLSRFPGNVPVVLYDMATGQRRLSPSFVRHVHSPATTM
jgi:DNA polymerase-3 subunit alpha